MKTNIKCPFCGYGWETGSGLMYVSCPSCLKKVRTQRKGKKGRGK